MKLTNVKTVILGSRAKFLHFDRPIGYSFENISAQNKSKIAQTEPKEPNLESMAESARKAKSRLKKIILSNAWQHFKPNGVPYKPQFPTFTFSYDVLDTETGHPKFKNFMKRLNYQVFKRTGQRLAYIAVPEFQKDVDFHGNVKPNGGRLHYHAILFNIPRIQNIHAFLTKVWGDGYVWNRTINSSEHLVNYVLKYIKKDFENRHIKFKNRYLVSKGIKRPQISYDQEFAMDFCRHLESLGEYQLKEYDYQSIDGRSIHEIELIFPDGFDVASQINKTLQDTEKLARKIFGVQDV